MKTVIRCALAVAGAATMAGRVDAQVVSGAGDDAIPVSKGTVRIRVTGQWNDWDAVFADSAGKSRKRPLLSLVGRTDLGTSTLARLQPAETAIRTLTGQSAFRLSLGTLEARGDVRQSTAPIAIDVGVTRRVSIGIVIPYVESRDNTLLILNRPGSGATVGVNPAFGPTGAAARAANASLLRQITLARTQLTAELARCTVATAVGCDAIRADLPGAQQLLVTAQSTLGAIAVIYGDSVRGGSPVVPFATTPLGLSIEGAIAALRSTFERFGVTSIATTSKPVGATTAYGPGSLTGIANDSALGLGYKRLGNTRRAGIGDIDLTASLLLFDSFGANQRRRLVERGRAVRSLLAVGWRFGSAAADDPLDAFDVPIGDGANALLVRSTTDLVLSRRLWMSATLRLVKPFADNIVAVLPVRTDSTFLAPFSLGSARRALGQRMDLEVAPRVAFGDFFGLSAAYLLRRIGASTLDALSDPGNAAGSLFRTTALPTTFQAASLGVSFSTLSSYVRGRSRLPLEVLYTHTAPITASGGIVPAVSTDRLELRIYTGFPRR